MVRKCIARWKCSQGSVSTEVYLNEMPSLVSAIDSGELTVKPPRAAFYGATARPQASAALARSLSQVTVTSRGSWTAMTDAR